MNQNENINVAAVSDGDYLNEYVTVKLFKDNNRYRDKRGEWVKIKRKFAMVLDQSEIQDMQTEEMLEAEQNRFLSQEIEQ